MEIWLIRHGQTLDNFTRIIAGHQPGQLSKLGVTQAQKTGKALQNESFNAAYVSDLNRTRKTFEAISANLKRCKNMKVFYESLLREKCGGDLEGQSLDLPKKFAQEANLDIRCYRPKNGESWTDVFERAKIFLFILFERHIKKNLDLETLGKGYVKIIEEIMPLKNQEEIEKEKQKNVEEEKFVVNNEENKIDNSEKQKKIEIIFDDKKSILNKHDREEKRKLSENLLKKPSQIIEIRKKISLIDNIIVEDSKIFKKILVVSHGGFIMELLNVINFLTTKETPSYKNSAQNCSIHVINIFCKNTKGKCNEKCPRNMNCIQIDVIRKNDIKHLI